MIFQTYLMVSIGLIALVIITADTVKKRLRNRKNGKKRSIH